MKKVLVFAMAAIMSLSMSLTAFAANSPAASDVHFGDTQCTTTSLSQEVTKAAASSVSVAEDKEIHAVFAEDISLPDGMTMPEGGVDLTITVQTVKAGDKVIVLHYNQEKWENIPVVSVKDKEVTAHFTSLSPVVIFVETSKTEEISDSATAETLITPGVPATQETPATPETSAAPETSVAPEATAAQASPKTGESNIALVAATAMMVFAATAVVSGLKAKKNY